jgi:hypothetical protein
MSCLGVYIRSVAAVAAIVHPCVYFAIVTIPRFEQKKHFTFRRFSAVKNTKLMDGLRTSWTNL